MVLRDDTINQQLLVPLDLRNLIPKDHPCYFIKNVVLMLALSFFAIMIERGLATFSANIVFKTVLFVKSISSSLTVREPTNPTVCLFKSWVLPAM